MRDMRGRARSRRVPQLVVASFAVLIGCVGVLGTGTQFVAAWQAAHGGGKGGTFVLVKPLSCDRYDPPRQRCGWVGRFTSDDGSIERRGVELGGGLPPGAKVGDSVRARHASEWGPVYRESDSDAWKTPGVILAGFSAAFLIGLALLEPWSWRARLRSRRARRRLAAT